jgi:hypothetical protein
MSMKFQNLSELEEDDESHETKSAGDNLTIARPKPNPIPLTQSLKHNGKFIKKVIILVIILAIGIIYVIRREDSYSFEDHTYKFPQPKSTPYDSHIPQVYSLRELCDDTVWQQNIYLNCTDLAGGTLNIQNSIVTCLRWAIDAGMGMLMPKIGTRDRNDPRVFCDAWMPISYLFDEDYFKKTLLEECPQLIIKETEYEPATKVFAEVISMKQYTQGTYRSHIYDLLSYKEVDRRKGSIVVVEHNPLLGWLFVKERPIIHKALLDMLRFNPAITSLALPILAKLPQSFVGFHLRAEKDFPWYSYDNIVTWFQASYQAKHKNIKTIYLAVGSLEIEEKFRKDMENLDSNVHVISKWTIGQENMTLISEMNTLRFDQIAIVDFEVMLHSDYFYGVGQSSFDYSIGFERGNGNMSDCGCYTYDVPDPRFVCCM